MLHRAGWGLVRRLGSSFTPLTPENGWTSYGSGTASPAARNISGIVYLRGAIKTPGTNPAALTLPAGDRPATAVFVAADMCNATNGRLDITPNGAVTVQTPAGSWANASCFTSLDGVSFATSANSFTPLTLENGWTSYGSGTAGPAVRNVSGIVHLEGAIRTNGTNGGAFTLPPGDRPSAYFTVKADLCGANNGSLFIEPSGVVVVETRREAGPTRSASPRWTAFHSRANGNAARGNDPRLRSYRQGSEVIAT